MPLLITVLSEARVRDALCPTCECRTKNHAPGVVRPCESDCAVFRLLPRLCDLIARREPEPPCGYELAVQTLVRHARESQALRPAVVPDPAASLDRQVADVIAIIDSTVRAASVIAPGV